MFYHQSSTIVRHVLISSVSLLLLPVPKLFFTNSLLKWQIEIVIKLSELLLFSHNLMQAYIARKSTLKNNAKCISNLSKWIANMIG